MHLTSAIDTFINFELTGEHTVQHEERITTWPLPAPQPGDCWPSLDLLMSNWEKVMDKAIENVSALGDEGMQKVGGYLREKGWNHPISTIIRWMVMHHHIHMRNLWCILGERRVDDKWDEQKMDE
jgi:hypothetical protein